MADLQTVMEALFYAVDNNVCADHTFRYGRMAQPYNVTHLMADALVHLKALVPRVLDLDEIHHGMEVYLEDIDKEEILLAIGGASAGGAKCFIDEHDRSIAAADSEYNIRWRAWSRKPNQHEREVTPWNSQP